MRLIKAIRTCLKYKDEPIRTFTIGKTIHFQPEEDKGLQEYLRARYYIASKPIIEKLIGRYL